MDNPIYKVIEVVGASRTGLDDAVRNAIQRAGRSVRNLTWFEVSQMRGQVSGDTVVQWQVGLKIGFALDEQTSAASKVPARLQDELEQDQIVEMPLESPLPPQQASAGGS